MIDPISYFNEQMVENFGKEWLAIDPCNVKIHVPKSLIDQEEELKTNLAKELHTGLRLTKRYDEADSLFPELDITEGLLRYGIKKEVDKMQSEFAPIYELEKILTDAVPQAEVIKEVTAMIVDVVETTTELYPLRGLQPSAFTSPGMKKLKAYLDAGEELQEYFNCEYPYLAEIYNVGE